MSAFLRPGGGAAPQRHKNCALERIISGIIIEKESTARYNYYRILKTTFYEGGPEEITGLHTEALGVLFPVDSMDSCEEMMIQDWPGALYKKDDTAFLCWTYSPEVTYVLEYTPSKIDDSEIIKMAESAEPVK